jgi:hypothetical protein
MAKTAPKCHKELLECKGMENFSTEFFVPAEMPNVLWSNRVNGPVAWLVEHPTADLLTVHWSDESAKQRWYDHCDSLEVDWDSHLDEIRPIA